MAIKIIKKQKDKYGNVWLRDNYGGWTNEYGVRFTKTEHRRFGYEVRKANRRIKEYMQEYPKTSTMRSREVGDRYRSSDLARFRRRGAYTNYLNVTKRVATGEQLYKRQPENYKRNLIKALKVPELQRLARQNPNLRQAVNDALNKIQQLDNRQIIELSRDARTPDINTYYVLLPDVQINNIERLLDVIGEL